MLEWLQYVGSKMSKLTWTGSNAPVNVPLNFLLMNWNICAVLCGKPGLVVASYLKHLHILDILNPLLHVHCTYLCKQRRLLVSFKKKSAEDRKVGNVEM